MNFDPEYNDGGADLTNEDNLVRWKFGELMKNVMILSSSADKQAEIMGIGAIGEEMAIDFDTYFTQSYQSYLEHKLITSDQVTKLKELDEYFNERSGDKSPDFWNDGTLDKNPEWEVVRQKAKIILEMFKIHDLTIAFDRTEKHESKDNGEPLIIQTTKTRLSRKKES